MFIMGSMRLRLVWMVLFWKDVCLQNNTVSWLDLVFCQHQSFPFCKRMNDFSDVVAHVLDGERYGTLNTTKVVVYGEQQVPSLKISEVKVLPDRILLITFNNGETRLFDMEELSGPVFEPLKDPDVYLHPNIEYGILTWKNGEIDCAPEYLYNHSYEYTMMVV